MSEPSVNSKVRLLGEGTGDKQVSPLPASPLPASSLAGRRAGQPAAPAVSIEPPAATSAPTAPVFLGDSADGADVLNAAQIVEPLAQLCVTREVQTPFLAGILGPSGAGKTFALRRLQQAIDELGRPSGARQGHGQVLGDQIGVPMRCVSSLGEATRSERLARLRRDG